MPAQQVRCEMAEVVLDGGRDGAAMLPGDVGQVERDIDVRDGAGAAPVSVEPSLGGPLDHPPGNGVPQDPPPARRLVRWV
ncbi:hypothetical protein [Nonomuraea sp. NPDC049158]|uniref:hypothetical protein n=1 Tax=Nonomuraea sp. NPDC049158 TaxID=3155649 RepID=UPI0033DB3862